MKIKSEFLFNVVTSPIGIGVSVTHWIVVLFSIFGELHQPSLFQFHFEYEPLLTQWLYVLNLPALIVSGLIIAPVMAVWEQSTITIIFAGFVWIVFITFQWLLVGYALDRIFIFLESKETNLSLFNE